MNIVSLFAGAGGLDLGFKKAGFNTVDIQFNTVDIQNNGVKLKEGIISPMLKAECYVLNNGITIIRGRVICVS